MKKMFTKGQAGLIPADQGTREWFDKLKMNAHVHGDLTQPRNYRFLAKYHCLMTYAFDCWKEDLAVRGAFQKYKGITVIPNYDKFRKDITILCGYSTPVYNIRGEVQLIADSIAFGNMNEETFEELYSKTIDVLLERIATLPQDKDEVRRIVDNLVMYA